MDNDTLVEVPAGFLLDLKGYIVDARRREFTLVDTINQALNNRAAEILRSTIPESPPDEISVE